MTFTGVLNNLVLGGLCVMLLGVKFSNPMTTDDPGSTAFAMTQAQMTVAVTMMSTEAQITTDAITLDPAAPLVPDLTVSALETAFNRTGCGTAKLCVAEPSDCDPSVAGTTCFFTSVEEQSGQNFMFQLSGVSEGYIAATLSADSNLGGNDTTYVCAQNAGNVQFFTAFLENGTLSVLTLPVNNVEGQVENNEIRCTFSATVPDSSTRAASFLIAMSKGSYDPTTGTLGTPQVQLQTGLIDLTNVNSSTTNTLNTTPTPATVSTTSGATHVQSLATALLLTLGIMSLMTL